MGLKHERLQLDIINEGQTTVALSDYDRYDPPPLPEDGPYDPFIGDGDLERLYCAAGNMGKIFRPWIIYAGASAYNDAARQEFYAKPETVEAEGLFHATVRLGDIRTAIRFADGAVHPTPFSIENSNDSLTIRAMVEGLGEVVVDDTASLESEANCLRNVAYDSDGIRRTSDTSVTINPLQSCPLRCGFCRRQYDQLDSDAQDGRKAEPLLNIRPDEMAAHLVEKYRDMNWESAMQVAFVTGSFVNFRHLYDYVGRFSDAMRKYTNDRFRPAINPWQNMHIMSHLVRTPQQFEALRNIGVGTVQDTIEIFDDSRREALMRKANPSNKRLVSKGDIPFDEALATAKVGVETIGPENYSCSVILGLDTYPDTVRGLKKLGDVGLKWLDFPFYTPFEATGIDLYAMSAVDLIWTGMIAANNFERVSTTWRPKD